MPLTLPWTPKRVLVSDPLHGGLGEHIASRRPDLEVRERLPAEVTESDVSWAQVFVGFRPPKLGAWRELPWVHCIGAGVDAWAFRTGLSADTLLTRTSEDFGPQMGEYCVARALAVTQRIRHLESEQAARSWKPKHPETLAGTRAVVVGTGTVGRGIARAFLALGCPTDGVSRSGAPKPPFGAVFPMAQFDRAVAGARWLVLACPLTDETFHLLNRSRLAACSGAVLINVGRGGLVEESVLPEALDEGWLSGTALDVFEVEPLPEHSPLWARKDVMISPHISGLTTVPGAGKGFLDTLDELERGIEPTLRVYPGKGY